MGDLDSDQAAGCSGLVEMHPGIAKGVCGAKLAESAGGGAQRAQVGRGLGPWALEPGLSWGAPNWGSPAHPQVRTHRMVSMIS